MSAGLAIVVEDRETERGTRVDVMDASERRSRYTRLLAECRWLGAWLSGPHGQALSERDWEARYNRHQEMMAELHGLGDELRPVSLRERFEPLSGEELVAEVTELFAA